MGSREHEPLIDSLPDSSLEPSADHDPHTLLFGHDDEPGHEAAFDPVHPAASRRVSRAHRRRVRRHRRAFVIAAIVSAIVVVVAAVVGYQKYQNHYHPADFTGTGTGSVVITVHPGDGASAIGDTLVNNGVVASTRAFVNAAKGNTAFQDLSAGVYRLRKHMSAAAAVTLLLDPAAKLSRDVVVFPGATVLDVAGPLAKAINVSTSAITAAMKDVQDLGLPSGYSPNALTSVEGFLYPATYTFDPGTSAIDALNDMLSKYIAQDRSSGFAAKAESLHLTPYAALIIASIAEKEAKMPADYPKVARVILNRIAAHQPLQIDATSAYAAKLQHLDPTTVVYATIDSPYNTYVNDGLPPTPISSPGDQALAAAVAPASGNWLYYVNSDAKGDLFFTNSETAFEQAVAKCRANHWGCG
ncbi:MAG TPA: endolytic transglycosylase MltG [Jatrophihabitantaceae bacterium]|nr:endolytic transglycosylase MltG [Jatrophihabitantaceae bacterium]